MKRVLFLLSSGLLLAGSAHAQLGVRAGCGLTTFTHDTYDNGDYTTTRRKLGYQVGVFYQVPLGKHFALVPELQFSHERFFVDKNYFFGEGTLRSEYDQSLSYLSLPILLRASLGIFYLEAGPQVGVLVGGQASGTQTLQGGFTGGTSTFPIAAAATDSYRRFDVGPSVGVGVKLPGGLGLGVRAYWGLTKLTSNETSSLFGQTYPGFEHRQSLQASLTYQLAAR